MAEVNPYSSPTADGDVRHHEGRGSLGVRVSRFITSVRRPSVLLSLFAVLHFSVSMLCWSFAVPIGVSFRFGPSDWAIVLWEATPAILFLLFSIVSLVRSYRRKRFALTIIGLVYVASIVSFCYDVAMERSQMQVGIATAEYWNSGGSKNTYFTWWWYNDSWLRRRN